MSQVPASGAAPEKGRSVQTPADGQRRSGWRVAGWLLLSAAGVCALLYAWLAWVAYDAWAHPTEPESLLGAMYVGGMAVIAELLGALLGVAGLIVLWLALRAERKARPVALKKTGSNLNI